MIRQQNLYVIVGHASVNGMGLERMRSKQSESSIYYEKWKSNQQCIKCHKHMGRNEYFEFLDVMESQSTAHYMS